MKASHYNLSRCALAVSLLLHTSASYAQTQSDNSKDVERMQVTGSHIKRNDLEGPSPVTVITRTDIDREGFQTVGDMLQTLTQNTTSSFTGDLAVTATNVSVIEAVNLNATTSGDKGVGVTLAFNTVGWEPQNVLFNALEPEGVYAAKYGRPDWRVDPALLD